MAISERIWLVVFTILEGILPFLCYFYPKDFSYDAMMFLLPIGMAGLYLLCFGKKRLFKTDVVEYAMFQMRLTAGLGFFFLTELRLMDSSFMYLLLFIGSVATILIDDAIFAVIFIVIGKIYGLESIFSKKRKESEEFYTKQSGPYGGFANIYEQMYWEELERRQREEFRRKRSTRGDTYGNQRSDFKRYYEERKEEMQKEPQPKFLFEGTLYFKSISSLEEVRPRYLSLMKQYHPDMPGGSKEIAQEIQSEYDKICKENGL